jgi:hypothetical protein
VEPRDHATRYRVGKPHVRFGMTLRSVAPVGRAAQSQAFPLDVTLEAYYVDFWR